MGVISSFGASPGMLVVDTDRCLRYGKCAAICPVEVLQSDNGAITVDNGVNFGCIACGQCMMVCSNASITVTGHNISPRESIKRIIETPSPPPWKHLIPEENSPPWS